MCFIIHRNKQSGPEAQILVKKIIFGTILPLLGNPLSDFE